MYKITFFIFLVFSFTLTKAQLVDWKKLDNKIKETEDAFNFSNRTKVLLLGTFHFNFPNNDSHKIDSSMMFDVLTDKRQKEIEQVTSIIKEFKPTKIYLELEPKYQYFIDSLYDAYVKGQYKLGRNEKYQIGFRLGKELKLNKLYAVDDLNWIAENGKRYKWIDSLWSAATVVDTAKAANWNVTYSKYYKKLDASHKSETILESLLYSSLPTPTNIALGHYLVGGFNTVDDKGPDRVALQWYSRNLRIFNNILGTSPKADDRILVIYGAGHMPILRHLFFSSPEFEIVEFKSLVEKAEKKN
jgi:hypothetical protein